MRCESTAISARAHGIAKRALADGHALGAADLDPSQRIGSVQIEQQLERPLFEAVGCLDAPHVVDDEGYVDSPQQIRLRQDVIGVEMQHHMPSKRLDPRDQAVKHIEVRHTPQVLDEIETNPANAACVQALQFVIRHRVLHASNTAIGAMAGGDGVQGHSHVRSMTTRVHDHRP
jgi:hypothetical protein